MGFGRPAQRSGSSKGDKRTPEIEELRGKRGEKGRLRLRGDRDSKEGITVPVMEGDPSLADAHSEEVATA